MSEIDKLYKNVGIEPIVRDNAIGRGYYIEHQRVEEYPPFTAEKQLNLIKWLGKRHCCGCDEKLAITIGEDNYSFISVGLRTFEEEPEIFTDYCFGAKQFDEALAGLINNLWQDLKEEEKEQVKGILNE